MSLSNLPRELIFTIADHLPTNSLGRLLRTCQSMRSLLAPALTTRIRTEDLASEILLNGIHHNNLLTVHLALAHDAAWHTETDRNMNCCSAILRASKRGQLNIVAALIAHYGPTILTDNDRADGTYCHQSPLECAIHRKDLALTTLILEHGASANRTRSYSCPDRDRQPLEVAAKYATAEIVEVLIKHGADLGRAHRSLFYAIKNEKWDMVRVLLREGIPVANGEFMWCSGLTNDKRTPDEVEAFVVGAQRYLREVWEAYRAILATRGPQMQALHWEEANAYLEQG